MSNLLDALGKVQSASPYLPSSPGCRGLARGNWHLPIALDLPLW